MTVWETQTQLSQTQASHKSKNDNNDEILTKFKTNEAPKAIKMHTSQTSSKPARKPRSPSALPSHPSSSKVGKLNQNTPEPFFDAKSPQPGDLVMGTAGDIHHPAAEYLTVSPSFVVFGIVRSYTYIKWSSKEGREDWCNYTNNYKRLDVVWEPVISKLNRQRWVDETMDDNCKPPRDTTDHINLPTAIPPVHHSKVRIICKKNNCSVDGLNDFIQEWISQHFKFNMHSGWKFKTQQNKKAINDSKKARKCP